MQIIPPTEQRHFLPKSQLAQRDITFVLEETHWRQDTLLSTLGWIR